MAQPGDLAPLSDALNAFAEERDWEQFHSPKNLAMALTVEAAELQEIFQWLTTEQSADLSEHQFMRVRQEIGDVFNYLIRLADQLDIDVLDAARAKIEENRNKYPVDAVKGSSKKYTEYD